MKVLLPPINLRLIAVSVTIVVIISIVYGVLLIEPWQSGLVNDDRDRTDDLTEINDRIKQFWKVKGELPGNLDELDSGSYSISEDQKFDSDGNRYQYNIRDEDSYELCANFRTGSNDSWREDWRDDQWDHPSGNHCFFFDDLEPFTNLPNPR